MSAPLVRRIARGGRFGVALITPPSQQPDYLQQFLDERKGFGAHAMDDFSSVYTNNILTVNTLADNGSNTSPTPGSFRAALLTAGPKIIRFAPDIPAGDIVAVTRKLPMTSDTLIDGYGWDGTVKAAMNGGGGISNFVHLNMSYHEPFEYGTSPSNKQGVAFSNSRHGYMRWCTVWDGGDALIASGAYDPPTYPAPYLLTVENCLIGPSPGEYAYMAPMRGTITPRGAWTPNTDYAKGDQVVWGGYTWTAAGPIAAAPTFVPYRDWVMPGLNNAIDNDARNGKLLDEGVDHNAIDLNPALEPNLKYASRATVINNILQGGVVRGPKASDQVLDVVGNLMTKFGHPYRVASGTANNVGSGLAFGDAAHARVEGNVWIPKYEGEQVFAMPHARADELGVPRMTVDAEGASSKFIVRNETNTGSIYIDEANNWLDGMTFAEARAAKFVDNFASPVGFDRTQSDVVNGTTIPGYSLTIPDVSTYAKAQAHVAELEAICGNKYAATTKPRYWRDTHTGGANHFPNPDGGTVTPPPTPLFAPDYSAAEPWGWQAVQQPTAGRITAIPAPGIADPWKPTGNALRVELQPGEVFVSGDGYAAPRSEVYARHAVPGNTPAAQWPDPPGSTRWYEWSVMVPAGFELSTSANEWAIITQFKGVNGGSPPLTVEVKRSGWRLGGTRTNDGLVPNDGALGAIVLDRWTRFKVGIGYSDTDGWVQVYRDGVEVLPRMTLSTLDVVNGTPDPCYFKQGIYQGGTWTQPHVLYFGPATVTDAGGTVPVGPVDPPTTAAPAFVGAATSPQTTSGDTITVPYPTGLASGDVLLLEHVLSNGATVTSPTGFTELGRQDDTSNALRSIIYKRTCDGTETGNITLTSTINRMSAVAAAYRNVADPTVYVSTAEPGTSVTAHDVPALTHTGTAAIVTFTAERGSNGTTTAAAPAGTVKRAEFGTSGTGGVFAAVADRLAPAASPQDLGSWTHNVAASAATTWAIALAPGTATPATPPAATVMRVGACPRYPGGVSSTAANQVITTWGNNAAVRLFCGNLTNIPARPAAASIVHASWNATTTLASITNAAVTAACVNLLPGDVVELIHELDHKLSVNTTNPTTGQPMTRAEGVALKNKFYDTVKAVRPDLKVCATWTGGAGFSWDSTTHGDLSYWADVKGDYLGLDLDGIVFTNNAYGNWQEAITAGKTFVDTQAGYTGLCFPEIGEVLTADDPTGSYRATDLTATLNQCKAAGGLYAMAYEYEPAATGYTDAFEDTPSFNAWKAFVV